MKSPPEETYDAARSDYFAAVDRFTKAAYVLLPHRVRALFPTAVSVEAASIVEVEHPTLRVQRVFGPDNVVLWPGHESDEEADRLADEVFEEIDSVLDQVADLTGDTFQSGRPSRFELTDTGAVWA